MADPEKIPGGLVGLILQQMAVNDIMLTQKSPPVLIASFIHEADLIIQNEPRSVTGRDMCREAPE